MNITSVSFNGESSFKKKKRTPISLLSMDLISELIKAMKNFKCGDKNAIIDNLFTAPTFIEDRACFDDAIKKCEIAKAVISIALGEDLVVKFIFFSENKKKPQYTMEVGYNIETGEKSLGPTVACLNQ